MIHAKAIFGLLRQKRLATYSNCDARVLSKLDILALVVFAALLLTGCRPDGVPSPVDSAVLAAIFTALKTAKDLQFAAGQRIDKSKGDKSEFQMEEDRHKGYFIHKRAIAYHDSNPNWEQESGNTTLITRIGAELSEVEAFLAERLGTAPGEGKLWYCWEKDGKSSTTFDQAFTATTGKHLDLQNTAVVKTGGALNRSKANQYLTFRVRAVRAIVWRAAAIHKELWTGSPSQDQTRRSRNR